MSQRRGVMLGLAAGLATASCVPPPPPAPERPLYVTRTGEPPPTGSAPRAGVLLPLSGAQAETGRALLEAARQALGEAEPGPLVLVPQDTAVDPAVAARHAAEVGCGLLIGPIGSDDARAAVAVADRPTLALSNDATIGRQDLWPLGDHARKPGGAGRGPGGRLRGSPGSACSSRTTPTAFGCCAAWRAGSAAIPVRCAHGDRHAPVRRPSARRPGPAHGRTSRLS